MAQHDYDINSTDSISGFQFRQDTNLALAAIKSSNSGAVAPTSPVAGMFWLDTSVSPNRLRLRDPGNVLWFEMPIEEIMATSIASAVTTTIGVYGMGSTLHITGTATISSFGVATTGTRRVLIFDGYATITHNATSLVCPGSITMTTLPSMVVEVVCENGPLAYWRITSIQSPAISINEIGSLDGITSNIQTQLNDKAPKISPTFTGIPAAPTAAIGTNTTQLATTAFVIAAVPNSTLNAVIKNTPVVSDIFTLLDSESAYGLKKITWGDIRNSIKRPNAASVNTNTAIGGAALNSVTTGYNNAAFGYALANTSTGYNNTAVGHYSLNDNTTGTDNTALGVFCSYASNTSYNTVIGSYSMSSNTSGSNNTAVGASALYSLVSWGNCSALGYNATVTGANQVQLGDAATTTYVYGTVQNRSDLRDKADIRDTIFGLDFINTIRPVDYRWDMREFYKPEVFAEVLEEDATEQEKAVYTAKKAQWLEDSKLSNCHPDGTKKRQRFHHGLIAQELQSAFPEFGGLQDHSISGGDDVLSIGYDELIAPMIKAIQELTQKVKLLEEANATRL